MQMYAVSSMEGLKHSNFLLHIINGVDVKISYLCLNGSKKQNYINFVTPINRYLSLVNNTTLIRFHHNRLIIELTLME